jgi:hypothetical protein
MNGCFTTVEPSVSNLMAEHLTDGRDLQVDYQDQAADGVLLILVSPSGSDGAVADSVLRESLAVDHDQSVRLGGNGPESPNSRAWSGLARSNWHV